MKKNEVGAYERNLAKFRAYLEANPMATYADIRRGCEIDSDATIAQYFKDCPDMAEILHRACQERFKGMEAEAVEQLSKLLCKGDWRAINYVLDSCGYKASEKVLVESNKIVINIED